MSVRSQISESAGAGRMLRPVAVSVILGVLVSVVILLLLSAVVSSRTIPQSVIDPMAMFALSVGAFSSGLCCAGIVRRNGLMTGLICGVIFAVLIMACSFAVPDNSLGLGAVTKLMIMLFSSMLGGVLGVNLKRRRK